VCPALGYTEFLHADWLVQILSWQKPVGCWGKMTNSSRSADNSLYKHEETGQQPQQQHVPVNSDDHTQQDVDIGLQPPVFRSRHLLYEKVVSGNH